jgi:hypothetical protein
MARILTSGAESASALTENVTLTGPGPITFDTATKRSGARSFKLDTGASSQTSFVQPAVNSSTIGSYFRAYLNFAAFPTSGNCRIFQHGDAVITTPTKGFLIQILSDGSIAAQNANGGATLGTPFSTYFLTTNTWYRFEAFTTYGVGATDSVIVRVTPDGGTTTELCNASGLNLNNDAIGLSWAAGWCSSPNANAVMYVDDIALNDTTGTDQNSFPGDGKVALLLPISDNARATLWTGGGGGLTNLWDAVNNTPPVGIASGNNTSQIEHAGGAAGTTDSYDANMTTYTTAGVGASDTVKLVEYVIVHGEDVATGTKLLNMQLVSNPTDTISANFTAGNDAGQATTYPTLWVARRNGIVYNPSVTKGTSPVARVRRPEIATRVASVCFMGVFVEYQPTGTLATLSATTATATAKAEASTFKAIAAFGATVATTSTAAQASLLGASAFVIASVSNSDAAAGNATLTGAAIFSASTATATSSAGSSVTVAAATLAATVALATTQSEASTIKAIATFAATVTTVTSTAEASTVAGAVAATFGASVATASGAAFSQYIGKITIFAASTATATAQARGLLINYASNPSVEVSTTGWAGTGTFTRDSADHFAGSWAGKVVATTTTNQGALQGYTPGGVLLGDDLWVGGERFSASAWIKAPAAGLTLAITLGYRNSANAQIGSVVINPISTGAWQQVKIEGGVIPPLTHHIYLHCYVASGIAINDVVWVDAFDYRREVVILGPTFDGSTSGAGWLGTANNSYSVLISPVETIFMTGAATLAASTATATATAGAATLTGAARTVARTATNRVINPSFEVNTTGWLASGAPTITRDTSKSWVGSASLRCDFTATNQDRVSSTIATTGLTLTGATNTVQASFWAWIPIGSVIPRTILRITYTDASAVDVLVSNITGTDNWQLILLPVQTTNPAKTISGVVLYAAYNPVAQPSPWTFWLDGVDIRFNEPDIDAYIDGDQGAGFAWTGTAHASTSTRSGVLVPANGLTAAGSSTLPAQGKLTTTVATASAGAGSSVLVGATAVSLVATVATASASSGAAALTGSALVAATISTSTAQAPISTFVAIAQFISTVSTANANAGPATLSGNSLVTATVATSTAQAGASAFTAGNTAFVSASVATSTSAAGVALLTGSARLSATVATATSTANVAAFAFGINFSALTATATSAAQANILNGAASLSALATNSNASAGASSFKAIALFSATVATASTLAQVSAFQGASGAGISAGSGAATASAQAAQIIVSATLSATTTSVTAQAGSATEQGQATLTGVVTTATVTAGVAASRGQALLNAVVTNASASAQPATISAGQVVTAIVATANASAGSAIFISAAGVVFSASTAQATSNAQNATFTAAATVSAATARASTQAEPALLGGALVVSLSVAVANASALPAVLVGGIGAFLRADVAMASALTPSSAVLGNAVFAANPARANAEAPVLTILRTGVKGYMVAAVALLSPLHAQAIAQRALTGRAEIVVITDGRTQPEVVDVITITPQTVVGLTAKVGINNDDCH